ncbi:HNH endonuclease [Mycolicibacterium conceptionense]|uniref:HNH endonuclease n=1 Tax=Mycolicibacterium conceptionense TaxID=451644 RepID=A0A0U1E0Z5_9MYCO|nr:HNH endonuclease signature motif containing protein [Mycolicibacterium conceptionense]CQD15904.1 HNH endonuclease [Mycolicibacterium conceptionense]CQD25329.1 HNH endonuclease [Mycolicibacterium conceptionense]
MAGNHAAHHAAPGSDRAGVKRSPRKRQPKPSKIELRAIFDPKFLGKFQSSVRLVDSGCLEWTGIIDANGYGRIALNGRHVGAYRVAWMLANYKQVPDGFVIDHLCCNRACVAAGHLEAVTPAENTRRIHRPPQGWVVAPESLCREISGAGKKWHVVEWREYDSINGKETIESRMFKESDKAEAEAFAHHQRTLPTDRTKLSPSMEIPHDILVQLEQLYHPWAVESWLATKNARLNDRTPLDMIRCGRAQEVRGILSGVC